MVTFQKTIVYMTDSLHELDSRYKDADRGKDGRNTFDTSDDDDKDHDKDHSKDDDGYDDDMYDTGLPTDVDLINNPTEPDWKKDEKKKREEERERNRDEDRSNKISVTWNWLVNWTVIPSRTTPKRGRWPLDRYGWDVELYEGQVFG
ncbi:serine/threonine-protein kinase prpf4B-like isoform X2 [Hyposmocoma kahamanoa]|uniref:serine/threonine-protein kinase prpf4B-like isoform X2 n=1 Tax=Hyposmocoma kahamanoa TaxID=1477025 RepID=UPI000E6D97FF|nr:serine/threonine-protein kinase prpf4B-like isoform X2 [Hyposmocoma kahamanoa]